MKRQLGEHALCAKAIRKILKKAFPEIKFSVRSQSYSMGDNVRVKWTDGIDTERVKELIWHFEYGTFDGMTDMYNNDNMRKDIPQTKYLFIEREISDAVMEKAFEIVSKYWVDYQGCKNLDDGVSLPYGWSTPRQFIWRSLQDKDLSQEITRELIAA